MKYFFLLQFEKNFQNLELRFHTSWDIHASVYLKLDK